MGSKNCITQTRVINSSGAGVNAESRLDLPFAASDPLSELVWSSHNGLSLKYANNTRTSDKKPFLLWNVGPSNEACWGSRDETVVDADDMFVDKATLLAPLSRRVLSHGGCDDRGSNGKMEEAAEVARNTPDLQLQKVPHSQGSAAGEVNKKEANVPISTLVPTLKSSPPVGGSERDSSMCLYKAKGKESEDDIHEGVRCCNGSGVLSRGIKRRGCVKDVMFGSKRIKNLIPLCSGSTSIPRHDSSFVSWMSNMVRVRGFSDSNGDDSAPFPLPLACSIDINAQNLHENVIDAQDSASLNMGFQTIFRSLHCKDMDTLATGEGKENEFIEESRQLMVDDKMTLDDLCLSKQISLCDKEVNPTLVPDQARHGIIPAESLAELINDAAEKTSVEIPEGTSDVPGKRNFVRSLWVTRFCTESPRSEKCQEIIQETIGCSASCSKLNLDSGMNPIDQKTSEAMSSVFSTPLDAFRHIIPPGNNVIDDNQKVPSLYDIVSAQKTDALTEIFHAIRNLRLSRADILRWMNSDMSLSRLNGFFLRLRLRKLDQGLEGTSYYVACISAGDASDSIGCSSNKSILVDVGGIKSCITSQYVSNHDFQEDEIKAWWYRALDTGCRVPSIDELNSKFNNRTSLGF